MNDPKQQIEYRGANWTEFEGRADLTGIVRVTITADLLSATGLVEDVAEFIGWHMDNVLPDLENFIGYDVVYFQVVER